MGAAQRRATALCLGGSKARGSLSEEEGLMPGPTGRVEFQ